MSRNQCRWAKNFTNFTADVCAGSVRHRRGLVLLVGLISMLALAGCHSASINATISNRSSSTISVVQVEYPSASFGTQSILPGHDFKYRFKVLGSGPVKIIYTDTAQVEHKFTGPFLSEANEGALTIAVTSGQPGWDLQLTHR